MARVALGKSHEEAEAKLKSFLVLRLHVFQSCVENRHKNGMPDALGCRWYSRHDGLRRGEGQLPVGG